MTATRGGLTDIGAATDSTVWGVNAVGNIFHYTWDAADSINIPGALKRISAGSRTNVWGVNAAGNIFRYTGDDADPWVQISGALSDIGAAADGTVLGSTPQIFRYTGDQGDPNHWVNISGALTAISAGNKTNVWGSTAQAISSRSRAMIVNPGFRSLAV